jgi:hypothetical protein
VAAKEPRATPGLMRSARYVTYDCVPTAGCTLTNWQFVMVKAVTTTARFRKRFFDDLQPKGIIEVQLTQTLADCSWRLNCARAYETNLLTLGAEEQLASIKIEEDDPEIHSALATAKSYRSQANALASISMHEQRVSREFHRSLKELREIRAERRFQERVKQIEAASLYKLHNEQQQAAAERARVAAPDATIEPATPYDATEDALAHDSVASFLRMLKSKLTSNVKTEKQPPAKLT